MHKYRYLIILLFLLLLLPLSAKKQFSVPDSLRTLHIDVHGVSITMQRVEGGSFVMGATPDQYDPDTYTDKPAHLVFLSPFYIATTEVTNRLWRAVMNEREMLDLSGYPEHPVSFVSWHQAQVFVRRLDSITGMPFRLPTEAEWEFAARGGEQTKHFRFAGANEADTVGWLFPIAGQWTHPVACKRPNEIGLYDMTGNVAEWCQDLYGPYQLSTRPDPCGADTGSFRIVRGGSYDNCIANSHLSVRQWYEPETAVGYIGFRVALTLPNDPMKQVVTEEPELTKKVRLKGRRLHFALVPGEEPYYISEEVSATLWKKVTGFEPPDKEHGIAISMPKQERIRFAELCSRIADKPLSVATLAEVDSALAKGIIPPPRQPKHQRSVRATQRSRKTREKLSPWAELIGVKIKHIDDPILLEYKGDANEKLPLRLVLR
ncbi:MAG: formylglycine-generating enzyme family protein [Paludibacteraceae bacterium]|nr:formylglycine-generating enzyme family protein [Paludibacteraceae bacterium]